MQPHSWVAIVTLVALLVYVWMALQVAWARRKAGIDAPTMTGDPVLERTIRVQANTLEWLPIFLPSLWMFAVLGHGPFFNDRVAAVLGLIWIAGRFLYMTGYSKAAGSRSMGFSIQALATAVLLFGSLVSAVMAIIATGQI